MKNLYGFYSDRCLVKFPERDLFLKEKIGYKRAFDLACQRAVFLKKEGYQKGDVLAILGENCADWVITFMAVNFAGGYALLLDPHLDEVAYRKMLTEVSAKAVFISEKYDNFDLGDIKRYPLALNDELLTTDKFEPVVMAPDDIAALFFTSGTTGESKIVPLTHANFIDTAEATIAHFEKDISIGDKVFYGLLPIYHVFGLMASVVAPISAGARIVFQNSFKGPDILADLKEYKINIFPAVPRIFETFHDKLLTKVRAESKLKYSIFTFMIDHAPTIKHLGLGFVLKKIFKPVQEAFGGHIDFFISGGARLSKRVNIAYENMGFKMVQGFGLTETLGPITINKLNERKAICAGCPTRGNEAKIKNINPDDGIGEICLRGLSVFSGYYKNEAANKEVFDEDGWFMTGDLGFIDGDGFIHIRGRKKNVIVLDSGKNVYPEDLEAHYQKAIEINELTVFGRKENGKEYIYAVIVPEQKTKDSYRNIKKVIKRMGHGLPSYKKITDFAISYDVLPKTSTQKVKKHEVIKELESGVYQMSENDPRFNAVEIVAKTPEEEELLATLFDRLKIDVIYTNQRLEDYEIDSLDYIELISFLENKYKIKIDVSAFVDSENMEKLFNYLVKLITSKETVSASEYLMNSIIKTRIKHFYNPLIELSLFLIKWISKIFWRLKVVNPENFKIDNTIIVANHQSYLDVLWIYAFLPYRIRKNLYIATKKELSFMRYFLPGIHFIFVDREGSKFIPILKAEADILRQGKSLIIFPEGTRTANGKIGDFRSGAAFLATSLGKELLPITISGGYEIYPRHKLLPKFFTGQQAELYIHKAVDPKKYNNYDLLNDDLKKIISKAS